MKIFSSDKQKCTRCYTCLIFLMTLTLSCSLLKNDPKEDDGFPNDALVDRSFVSGKPCEAPCWYGLKLGESTADDIRQTLQELPFIDNPTLFEYTYSINEIHFGFDCVYFHVPGGGGCGSLDVSADGKLSNIYVSVQYPLTLNEVISKIDYPQYYFSDFSPNENVCFIEIFWTEKNISVFIEEGPREKVCTDAQNGKINFNLQIKSLIYSEINVQQLLDNNSLPWPDNP